MVITRKIIWIMLALWGIVNTALAQDGNPLQYLTGVSQSSRFNPALQNQTEKLVIGLPLLSGTKVEWDANFSFNYLFSEGLSYSFDNFYNLLDEPGEVVSSATIPIIFLSYKEDDQTFGLSISERVLVSSNFDREVLHFLAQGLSPYYGNDEKLGPMSLKTNFYREVCFSYARQATKQLSIGARAKVLFGKYYYDMENLNVEVKTLPGQKILQIIPVGSYTISGPIRLETDGNISEVKPNFSPGDYFFKFRNMGAAFDFGLTYENRNRTSFSFSLTDIGFTTLKDNAYDIDFDGAMDYAKRSLYQSYDSSAPNYKEAKNAILAFTDSIPYVSSPKACIDRKVEMLPMKINLSVAQQINDRMKIGFSDNFTYLKDNSDNFTSIFLYTTLGERIELTTNLVCRNFEKIFQGLGFSYTARSAQFYLSTNNIFRLVQPSSAKNINLCFGVNFLFSTHPK